MIAIAHISIEAGVFALRDLSLAVGDGQYGVLMGPTGCGKTTLLEIICGLRKPLTGTIMINGRDVTGERPGNRGIGYVPQDGALFPTMSVRNQLGFGPHIRRWPKNLIVARVAELADELGITHLLERLPQGLSGGERQRVALGRALAARPAALLLDEPLSALDEDMRGELRELLKRIQRQQGISVLHVTHDHEEARELADATFVVSRDGVCTASSPALMQHLEHAEQL